MLPPILSSLTFVSFAKSVVELILLYDKSNLEIIGILASSFGRPVSWLYEKFIVCKLGCCPISAGMPVSRLWLASRFFSDILRISPGNAPLSLL